ncbi:ABC transporter permease [Kovacikia minuta CCNUW1]|uniref:ABC transporter permease n=1 Tax=Kovacikia minuta TaxID=2931930 RepID=UPI001CC94C79|nr:ABC transporter permease [Kovacikia minuta]UBF25433.1 ABC transporter permease [Kovacikia minuta CCNUW1]
MLTLFLAELKRRWILFRRYSTETIAGIVGLTVAFYGLFLTTRYVAGPGLALPSSPVSPAGNERLDAIVVGYVLWSLVTFIVGDIAGGLQQEALTGTLEQIFLTPYGAPTVFIIRALANLLLQLAQNLVILLIIMALTGSRLSFSPLLLLPLLTVLLGAYGLALAAGSLALLLKRVQQLLGFLPFGLVFMLMVPTENWTGASRLLGVLLPMTPGAEILRQLMARGVALNWGQFAIALLNGVTYFAVGVILFHWAAQEAKRQGKVGGY